MRTKKLGAVVAGLVIGLAALGGCSSKVTPEDLKKQLTTGADPMPQQQADCIVDGLVAKGVPLENYSAPSADEQSKLTQVITDCVNKTENPGAPAG